MPAHIQKQPKRKSLPDSINHDPTKTPKRDPPPFVTHYKSSEGKKYNIGNTLDHDGSTFHYCDYPLHRNKLKWHTHHPDQCRICNRWMKDKDSSSSPPADADAAANISVENNVYEAGNLISDETSTTSSSKPNQDVQAILATAMNLVTDNDIAKDFICDASNACNDNWKIHQRFKIVCLFLFVFQIAFLALFYPLIITLKYSLPRFSSSLFRYICTMHHKNHRRRLRTKFGRPPPPFSIIIQDASFPISLFTLSSIYIDHQSCHLQIHTSCTLLQFTQINQRLQRWHKRHFNIRNRFFKLLLFPLLILQISPTVHAVPGTNYSIVKGVHTNDTSRQLRYAKSIIQQTASSTTNSVRELLTTRTSSVATTQRTYLLHFRHC